MASALIIELFTSNSCSTCEKAKTLIKALIAQQDNPQICYHELDVVTALDYAVSLGILTIPAIVINGELVFSNMPTRAQLQAEIQQRLKK